MMSNSRLTPLQQKILACLAQMDPPWTLIGGAALAGFHLHHRTTRDLDLFWSQPLDMSLCAAHAVRLLENEKLHCKVVQRTPTFVRLLAEDGRDQVVVDLVDDPSSVFKNACSFVVDGVSILVAPKGEILAAKFCTLLSRAEIRDLLDVMMLLESGESFDEALEKAAKQDSGFSAMTLAWVIGDLNLGMIGRLEKIDDKTIEKLERFKEELIERLMSPIKSELTNK